MGRKLMDPTGMTETGENSLAPRSDSLDGAVVGLLWNKKSKGDQLLKRVADLLKKDYQIKEVIFQPAPDAGKPTPSALMDELAAKCDVVLTAAGD